MAWKIIEQTMRVRGEEFPVKCKQISCIPDDRSAELSFMRLGYVLLQIIVENERGERRRVKWHNKSGMPGRFIVQLEDTTGQPTIWVGEGKRRRQIPDMLAKPVTIPGKKYTYDYVEDFIKDNKYFGESLTNEMLTLFANKIGEVCR